MTSASTKRMLALLFSIAGFFYSAYLLMNTLIPAFSGLTAMRQDILEKEAARDRLQDIIAKAQEFLARSAELADIDRKIGASLPTDPKLAELVAILAAISSKNNVLMSQVRFEVGAVVASAQQTAPSVSKVRVSVNVVGKYADIKNWLRDVENEARLLDAGEIEARSIVGPEQASADTPINAAFLFEAYWQPLVKAFK